MKHTTDIKEIQGLIAGKRIAKLLIESEHKHTIIFDDASGLDIYNGNERDGLSYFYKYDF